MATSSSISDYGLTTDGIFLRAPRLTKDDVGGPLSESDIDLIEKFEDAWKDFLSSRPGTLPPGQKIKNFRNIQTQLNEVEAKKQNVCIELQHQLDFVATSKNNLEERYNKEKEEATIQRENLIRHLEKEIDDIAMADKLLSEVLPWEHYFSNLESKTPARYDAGNASIGAGTGQNQAIRPSDEALYLANVEPCELVDDARRGNSNARLIRAYRIDNALLMAKAAMMKREVDRLERNIRSDRVLSKFLMDNDVWEIMASGKE
eukprot:CAMPEP_0197185536 /NCGR_PEP_ID=MMETSP1423-20130617/12166_1 /TAXON_ID=476441 /ORGANISM="Pseudo-nitzschia heimii, Strain UNC1101" /LENGTH=260 /DNA_ID=CAMNT_0042636627 /DNA_START=32 /DNA_END=814 /DNA_ORIENTATION=+